MNLVILASGGGLSSLLEVNPGLVIWTLVTFLLVVFILKKFAWEPILHALDQRAERIHGDIEKAAELKKQAEDLLAGYEKKVSSAQDEANKIVDEARRDAAQAKNKAVEETAEDIRKMKEQAIKDIELSKQKAVHELHEQVVELSVLAAGQILQKKLKAEDYASFVKSEIEAMKKIKV